MATLLERAGDWGPRRVPCRRPSGGANARPAGDLMYPTAVETESVLGMVGPAAIGRPARQRYTRFASCIQYFGKSRTSWRQFAGDSAYAGSMSSDRRHAPRNLIRPKATSMCSWDARQSGQWPLRVSSSWPRGHSRKALWTRFGVIASTRRRGGKFETSVSSGADVAAPLLAQALATRMRAEVGHAGAIVGAVGD